MDLPVGPAKAPLHDWREPGASAPRLDVDAIGHEESDFSTLRVVDAASASEVKADDPVAAAAPNVAHVDNG